MNALIVICGATASRKSELALQLADARNGELVCCDSVQMYRGMRIGSAGPDAEQLGRAPHHLYYCLHPHDAADAGRYARLADETVAAIHARGAQPIVVGGAGLYLRAFLWGLAPVPPVPADVRERLAAEHADVGNEAMFARLEAVDPEGAGRLEGGSANTQRILRALEVFEATGQPLSAWQAQHRPRLRYPVKLLAPVFPPEVLARRIDERVDRMMGAGFLDEVRTLLDDGVDPTCRAMGALGYKELAAHLAGELSLEVAVDLIKRGHRRYAKRQRTWFRKTPGVEVLDATRADLAEQARLALARGPLALPS